MSAFATPWIGARVTRSNEMTSEKRKGRNDIPVTIKNVCRIFTAVAVAGVEVVVAAAVVVAVDTTRGGSIGLLPS